MKRILSLLVLLSAYMFAHSQKEVATSLQVASMLPISGVPASTIITIPVVVHVVYNTATQNISDAQVMSQIEVLNKDYRGKNEDRKNIPAYYAAVAGDAGFEFRLATVDPSGYSTNGIIRKQTNIKIFGTDDRIKASARGGDNAWDKNKYLNIWVGNLAGGILGYTSTVGCDADKDGVVIQFSAFGTVGAVAAPFNLGRTATHEVAHWLNLRHIWGDAYCGDDEVDDTPRQRSSNRGMPTGEKFSCDMSSHGDMYMNFMDLTDDAGMFMFTQGQCKRMKELFKVGGQRYQLLASNGLSGTGLAMPTLIAAASVKATRINVYPNPGHSLVTIDLGSNNNEGINSIVVFNNLGQPVIKQTNTASRIQLNITALSPGIYFIQANGDPLTMTKVVRN